MTASGLSATIAALAASCALPIAAIEAIALAWPLTLKLALRRDVRGALSNGL